MRNTTLNTKSLNLTLIAGAFALALMAPVHAQVVGGGGLAGGIGGAKTELQDSTNACVSVPLQPALRRRTPRRKPRRRPSAGRMAQLPPAPLPTSLGRPLPTPARTPALH